MNAMERLVAASKGEPCDRIPVFCDLLDQGARELGISSLRDYYANGEYVAEAQLKMREKFGYDNLWSLFYVGREAEMLGCRRMVYAADGPPNVGEMVIRSQEDIYRLEVPDDITSLPAIREPLKCLDILRREAGGKYPICAYVTASMTLPALLMGMEKWMELLLTGPAEVRDVLLEKCSLFFQREIAAYRAAGADVLVYSNPFGSTDFLPLKLIRQLCIPWMERDLLPGGIDGVLLLRRREDQFRDRPRPGSTGNRFVRSQLHGRHRRNQKDHRRTGDVRRPHQQHQVSGLESRTDSRRSPTNHRRRNAGRKIFSGLPGAAP